MTLDEIQDIVFEQVVFSEDCKCESPHKRSTCSFEVTHLISCCIFEVQVCKNAANVMIKDREAALNRGCAACSKTVRDCWKVRPI